MYWLLLSSVLFRISYSQITSTITQWQITNYYIEGLTTSVGDIDTDLTFTDTTTIILDAPVPTFLAPTGVRATSSDVSSENFENAAYTTLYLAATAIPGSQLAQIESYANSTLSDTEDNTHTSFVIEKVYTAPSSCKSQFTFTTTSDLNVPIGAETQLPTGTSTSTSPGVGIDDTWLTAYLAPGLALPVASGGADYVQSDYVDQCSEPGSVASYTPYSGGGTYSGDGGPRSGGGDDDDFDRDINCLGSLCPFWLIYIVVIIPVIGLLFIGGLFESYFWFSRLMRGQFALRGVPLMWVAISLWTLCCLRRKHPANQAFRPQLEKQWREMSTGKHISLWLSYGFRHRDPPELTRITGAQQAPGAVWAAYPNQPQQQPYYGPPPGGPGGFAPPMQQAAPPYYAQYPPWQASSPPPPGQPHPPQGYYPPPAQAPPYDKSMATATTTATANDTRGLSPPGGISPGPIAEASSGGSASDFRPPVSPMSAEGSQGHEYQEMQSNNAPGEGIGVANGGEHSAPEVMNVEPKNNTLHQG